MPAAAPLTCCFLVDNSGVRRIDQSFPNFTHSSERVLFLRLSLVWVSSKQIDHCFYTQGFPGTLWTFFPWLHDCLYWYMRTANFACVFEIFVKSQQWPTPSESIAIYCVRKLVSWVTHLQSCAKVDIWNKNKKLCTVAKIKTQNY